IVTQVRQLPAGHRGGGADGIDPGTAVGAQHARYIQGAAAADIAQRAGFRRATVDATQYAEHRLWAGVSEDDPRQARREQPIQGRIIHYEGAFQLVPRDAQPARLDDHGDTNGMAGALKCSLSLERLL